MITPSSAWHLHTARAIARFKSITRSYDTDRPSLWYSQSPSSVVHIHAIFLKALVNQEWCFMLFSMSNGVGLRGMMCTTIYVVEEQL